MSTYTERTGKNDMKEFYQHNNEVIEAARILKQELLDDAPYGNDREALQWVTTNYPSVIKLASQTTEAEEERATPKL